MLPGIGECYHCIMKHTLCIPLFRADKISEAREAEIVSELTFASRAEDYEAEDYWRVDGPPFRIDNILHLALAFEAEDRHAAYALACEQVELALEVVDQDVPQAA